VLAAGLTAARGYPIRQSLFFGFLVVTCSTVIILQLLVERREMDSPHGRFLVGINVFGDLMVVPMMLLIGPLAGSGGGAAGALFAIGKAAAAAVLVFFAARFLVPRVLHAVAATRRKELFLLAVLLLVLGTPR
jgi:CPA2 family monovalent cation:H+ antiporter-2